MKSARSALIIDDEKQIRRLLRLALEGADHQVYEAETGQAGLAEIVHHRPDVVLLDLGLPDMDGLKVLRRLREWSDVPVLILSVRDDPDEKVAALDGARGPRTGGTTPLADRDWRACFYLGIALRRFRSAAGEARRRRDPPDADGVRIVASTRAECRKGRNPSAVTSYGLGRESRKPGAISSGLRYSSAQEA